MNRNNYLFERQRDEEVTSFHPQMFATIGIGRSASGLSLGHKHMGHHLELGAGPEFKPRHFGKEYRCFKWHFNCCAKYLALTTFKTVSSVSLARVAFHLERQSKREKMVWELRLWVHSVPSQCARQGPSQH